MNYPRLILYFVIILKISTNNKTKHMNVTAPIDQYSYGISSDAFYLESISCLNQQLAKADRAIYNQEEVITLLYEERNEVDKTLTKQDSLIEDLCVDISDLKKHIKVLQELCNEQSLIINACMAEVPVGNYITHTPENLAERISYIVTDQCRLFNGEEQLCDLLDVDELDEAIEVIQYMQDKHCVYREALETIREGTDYSQELAAKILGWTDSYEYDIDDLRDENLELKMRIEDLSRSLYNIEYAMSDDCCCCSETDNKPCCDDCDDCCSTPNRAA